MFDLENKSGLIKSIEQLQLEILEQVKVEEESYAVNELNNMVGTLAEAKSQLEVEKYKIVFIGEKLNFYVFNPRNHVKYLFRIRFRTSRGI